MKFFKYLSVLLCLSCLANSAEESVYAKATTDTGFKQLLSNLEVAKDIINCIVPDFQRDNIRVIEQRPVAIPPLKEGSRKQTFMDFHVVTESNKHVIIEMQARRHEMFDERALFYSCYTFSHQITDEGFKRENWYFDIEKVYAIQFLDFDTNRTQKRLSDKDTLLDRICDHKMQEMDYLKHYVFTDRFSGQEIDTLQMIQIELPRASRVLRLADIDHLDLSNKTQLWLAVLKYANLFHEELPEQMPEIIKDGFKMLHYSTWNPEIQAEYREELSDMTKYASDVNDKVTDAVNDAILHSWINLFISMQGRCDPQEFLHSQLFPVDISHLNDVWPNHYKSTEYNETFSLFCGLLKSKNLLFGF